jgi:hypothetical protein
LPETSIRLVGLCTVIPEDEAVLNCPFTLYETVRIVSFIAVLALAEEKVTVAPVVPLRLTVFMFFVQE